MLPSSKLIYLATPYSHSSTQVRQERFEIACRTAGLLMRQGVFLYCPIAHAHPIACTVDLPFSWEYWKEYELMLSRCNELWIVKMPGWDVSVGIAGEIEIANRLGKPVRYFLPAAIEDLRDFLGWTPIDKVICEFAEIARMLDIIGNLDLDKEWLRLYGDACTSAIGLAVKEALNLDEGLGKS